MYVTISLPFLTPPEIDDKIYNKIKVPPAGRVQVSLQLILWEAESLEQEYCVDFEPYENDELEQLILSHGRRVEVPKGTYFVRPGEILSEISYILEGKTAHTMFNASGQEKISYVLTHGWFLAESLFANGKDRSMAERYSYAQTSLVLYKIDKETYETLIAYPVFRDSIIRSLSNKRAFLQRELESVILERAKDRLKKFFVLLSDPSSSPDGKWYPLSHEYTHRDIASIIGTNRVTISRFISELAREDFLRVINKHIQINSSHISECQ